MFSKKSLRWSFGRRQFLLCKSIHSKEHSLALRYRRRSSRRTLHLLWIGKPSVIRQLATRSHAVICEVREVLPCPPPLYEEHSLLMGAMVLEGQMVFTTSHFHHIPTTGHSGDQFSLYYRSPFWRGPLLLSRTMTNMITSRFDAARQLRIVLVLMDL
jgi:hypothetical protein